MKYAGTVILYQPDKSIKENIMSYLPYIEKLYVVDNSMYENEALLPKSKKIVYINNKQNLGIAKSLNLACDNALKDGFDFILTMDQDSKFKEKEIGQLVSYVNNENGDTIGIISPYHNIITKIKKSSEVIDHPLEVMTSGNLLNLKAYQKVGKFNEDLFIDCVDTWMCLNLKKNGYDIIRLNNVILDHKLGNASIKNFFGKKIICSNHAPIRRYYMMRNTLYLIDEFKNDFPEYCKYLKKVQNHQMVNVLLEKKGFKKFIMMVKGIRDYKKNVKGKYQQGRGKNE